MSETDDQRAEVTRLTHELARTTPRFMAEHRFVVTGPAPFWCDHCKTPCSVEAPCQGCQLDGRMVDVSVLGEVEKRYLHVPARSGDSIRSAVMGE